MGFDDRKTDPIVAVGCLSVVCGLLVPAINRLTGGWWGLLFVVPPFAVWGLLECVWRSEDRNR
jgi:hypothetical protein